jgi:hypothetical protein
MAKNFKLKIDFKYYVTGRSKHYVIFGSIKKPSHKKELCTSPEGTAIQRRKDIFERKDLKT